MSEKSPGSAVAADAAASASAAKSARRAVPISTTARTRGGVPSGRLLTTMTVMGPTVTRSAELAAMRGREREAAHDDDGDADQNVNDSAG